MATSIQWTDDTFNCITGCTRVSEGCRHCYAERLSGSRLQLTPKYAGVADNKGAGPRWTGKINLHPELLSEPLRWRPKPSKKNPGGKWMVFVNDMSDTFHEDVPDSFLDDLFQMFGMVPHVVWQVLTKRSQRMRKYFQNLLKMPYPKEMAVLPNVWLGVSVEDQKTADERIPLLLDTPAAVRFVSYEPALGPVNFAKVPGLNLCGSRGRELLKNFWFIVGGESGKDARPFDVNWACATVDQCGRAGVPCFVKQLGSNPGKLFNLKDSHGGDMDEWPADLRVRQWPKAAYAAS